MASFILDIILHYKDGVKIYQGVLSNVFGYRSANGNSFIFISIRWVESFFDLGWVEISNFLIRYSFGFYFLLILLTVILLRNRLSIKNIYFVYLLVFYSFSPSLADQYLLIPTIALIVLDFNPLSLIYLIFSSLYLFFGSGNNINFYFNLFPDVRKFFSDYYFLSQALVLAYLVNYGLSYKKFSKRLLLGYITLSLFIFINLGLMYITLFTAN